MIEAERLKGSIVPLVTPFDGDGKFDERSFRKLIRWQIRMGSQGVSVAGSTGEPTSLNHEERIRTFSVAVEEASGRVPVVAGTGTANLNETVALTREAESAGCDAALVVPPYYSRPNQDGLRDYFRRVASSTSLNLIIYNIPARTGVNIEPATVRKLRKSSKNIVGIKEANRDFEQMSKDIRECGEDFLVYSGIELLCFPLLAIGGAGYFSATANIFPRELARLYELVQRKNWERAKALHYWLLPLNEALFWDTNPIPVKAALGMMGKITPTLRLPLVPLAKDKNARLRTLLRKYNLVSGEH
jgi:4-hydroxy-tetrahydrodipicolinate synthase